tara:strand:- start:2268 stop:3158 length:891 start_codon:yes stop_codon:yes gene_type:complete
MDPLTLGLIMGGSQVLGGVGQAIFGGAAKRRAEKRRKKAEAQVRRLEASRQEIINPFEGAEQMLTNPFANLTVATQAAEMQAQQTDLSLASTLDTLRATGAGAGGATALAQAALSAKQGVAASIAQQEAQNQRLRAQGQARLESQLFQAQAQGRQFVFQAQERREMQQLNRAAAQASNASQQQASAEGAQAQAFGQILGGVGSIGIAGAMGGFGGGGGATGGGGTTPSDRRLKNNIKLIGYSPSGLKIYNFSYIGDNKVYQGVMSDEIPQYAVIKSDNGYDKVYYDKIDVEFKLIK